MPQLAFNRTSYFPATMMTRRLLLTTALLTTLGLTGCQHYSKAPTLSHPNLAVDAQNQFNLQGKIGIKTPEQSGSAFYSWQQNQDHFIIQLNGILGMGKTIIQGQPGEVSLDSAKTGLIKAANPEELLEQATGWNAPITYLIDWVQARPANAKAHTQLDAAKRVIHIEEAGWSVELSYQDNQILPNKLILLQQADEEHQNRITLLIQSR